MALDPRMRSTNLKSTTVLFAHSIDAAMEGVYLLHQIILGLAALFSIEQSLGSALPCNNQAMRRETRPLPPPSCASESSSFNIRSSFAS